MRKNLLLVIVIVCIGIISIYINYKNSLPTGSGYIIGRVSIVGSDGNEFGVTIEKAKGFYKDYIGKSPTFEKYDFTQFENNRNKTISFGNKLSNGEGIKVFHQFINGHMVVTKIQELNWILIDALIFKYQYSFFINM